MAGNVSDNSSRGFKPIPKQEDIIVLKGNSQIRVEMEEIKNKKQLSVFDDKGTKDTKDDVVLRKYYIKKGSLLPVDLINKSSDGHIQIGNTIFKREDGNFPIESKSADFIFGTSDLSKSIGPRYFKELNGFE